MSERSCARQPVIGWQLPRETNEKCVHRGRIKRDDERIRRDKMHECIPQVVGTDTK